MEFDDVPGEIEIEGEIGLPFGVNFSEVIPLALVGIDLAGVNILPQPFVLILFDLEEGDLDEWKFRDEAAALGIRKLDIDWKSARFDFKQHDYPIKIESRLITTSETLLTLKVKQKDRQGPLTVDIGGLATVNVDAAGDVTATVPVEVEKPGKEFTLTLPFPAGGQHCDRVHRKRESDDRGRR